MLSLTNENYHSIQANLDYMSRSQYIGFAYVCEAREMAKLAGTWIEFLTTPLIVGNYVHSWNSGTQVEFVANNPWIFTKANTLRAEYQLADEMIVSLQDDPFVMACLDGEKDKILTAEMYGATWKIMMNARNNTARHIVDLRTTRSIQEKVWDEVSRTHVSFLAYYKAPLQAAIYTEIERLAMGRAAEDWSEFWVVAVSKEKFPDKAVFNMTDSTRLGTELAAVQTKMPRIIAVKSGQEQPARCEVCDYCKSTKVLSGAVLYSGSGL